MRKHGSSAPARTYEKKPVLVFSTSTVSTKVFSYVIYDTVGLALRRPFQAVSGYVGLTYVGLFIAINSCHSAGVNRSVTSFASAIISGGRSV